MISVLNMIIYIFRVKRNDLLLYVYLLLNITKKLLLFMLKNQLKISFLNVIIVIVWVSWLYPVNFIIFMEVVK